MAALITSPEPPRLTSAAVLLGYYTFFTGLFGQTIGMRLLGLACVRIDDGGRIGIIRALVRTILLQLVVPAVLTNKRGQGWHDRAANSLIVRVNAAASSSSVDEHSSAMAPEEPAGARPAR